MKLTEKTFEALEYLQAHGGRATTEEMRVALNCEKIASITGRYREKVAVEGEEKPLTYVQLTDAGINFVQGTDEE